MKITEYVQNVIADQTQKLESYDWAPFHRYLEQRCQKQKARHERNQKLAEIRCVTRKSVFIQENAQNESTINRNNVRGQ